MANSCHQEAASLSQGKVKATRRLLHDTQRQESSRGPQGHNREEVAAGQLPSRGYTVPMVKVTRRLPPASHHQEAKRRLPVKTTALWRSLPSSIDERVRDVSSCK